MPGPQMVPYAMVEDAQRILGVSQIELAEMLAISAATLVQAKKDGKIRKTYAIALNGLLAEARVGGHGQIKTGLPAVIETPSRPKTRQVSAGGKSVVVHAIIAPEFKQSAVAFFAGCGASIINVEEK